MVWSEREDHRRTGNEAQDAHRYLSTVADRNLNHMESPRSFTSRGLAVFPLLIMGACHLSIPPLRAMFELEPRIMYAWYGLSLILGFIIFRKTRVVKDFEYNRVKAMKKIKHVYDAEERGVWNTQVELDPLMDNVTKAGLSQPVSNLSKEAPEMQVPEDDKIEVSMLNEARHIVKANARVSGQGSFDDEQITGTIGAVRKPTPMDRFFDLISSLFGRDARAEREEQRRNRLAAAAASSPVTAQRPVAPLRIEGQRDDVEVNMTSYSDSGGVNTVITSSGKELKTGTEPPNKAQAASTTESYESMAMLGTVGAHTRPATTSGLVCRGCNSSVTVGERFCPNCGLDL